jgi:hypothetical protein
MDHPEAVKIARWVQRWIIWLKSIKISRKSLGRIINFLNSDLWARTVLQTLVTSKVRLISISPAGKVSHKFADIDIWGLSWPYSHLQALFVWDLFTHPSTLWHGTESKLQDRTNRGAIRIDFLDSYVPYKYAMEKFVNVGSISKDHIDPSIFCVLTAKSKTPGTSLADLLIFSPRWDIASNTFRPPVRAVSGFLYNLDSP